MNDKELLELAAKAAGIEGEYADTMAGSGINQSREIPCPYVATYKGQYDNHKFFKTAVWNPLTDDGDALRLANDCKIGIQFGTCQDDAPVVWCITEYGYKERSANFPDPYAATRRAIVRAAAEIGKELP